MQSPHILPFGGTMYDMAMPWALGQQQAKQIQSYMRTVVKAANALRGHHSAPTCGDG